jgi:hypothetical protein
MESYAMLRCYSTVQKIHLISTAALCVMAPGLTAHALELVSAGPSGSAGNYSSFVYPDLLASQEISADGRYVVFGSYADDLVAGDTNGIPDIFLRDRQTGTTELISVDSDEVLSAHSGCGLSVWCGSRWASVSNDGRFVAFLSDATNLVADDTNGATDAFVRDRFSGETIRISVSSAGQQFSLFGFSAGVMMAGDGDYALVYGGFSDGMNFGDIIRYDLGSQTAELLSISTLFPTLSFPQPTSISDDGNLVVLRQVGTENTPTYQFWLWNIDQNTIERIDVDSDELPGNAVPMWSGSPQARISGNGQFVAFTSTADNLVANDTNANPADTCAPGNDVFLRDLVNGTTERISITTAGVQADLPASCGDHQGVVSISNDGSSILFRSDALNFDPHSPENAEFDDTRYYLYSTVDDTLTKLYDSQSRVFPSFGVALEMSGDGNHFVFLSSDTAQDILQWPLNAFDSEVHVYHGTLADWTAPDADGDELADQDETTTFFTDPAKMDTDNDGLSDAAEIGFLGTNPTLADSDTDGVGDISDVSPLNVSVSTLPTMEIITVGESGFPGSDFWIGFTETSAVHSSGDGRFVVFDSPADDLVAGDGNFRTDVFLRDRQNQTTELISQSTAGVVADVPNNLRIQFTGSRPHGVSDDGRYVAFTSFATNLVNDDVNGLTDLFLRDRQAGTTIRVHETVSDLGEDVVLSRNGAFLFFSDGAQAYRYDVSSQVAAPFSIVAVPGATVLSASSDGQFLLVKGVDFSLWRYDATADVATQVLFAAPSATELPVYKAMISGDGQYVVFGSEAGFVPGDSNLVFPACGGDGADVFIWDSTDETFELVSVSSTGDQAQYAPFCGPKNENYPVAVSDDGSLVVFNSKATNLDPAMDIFGGKLIGEGFTYVRNRTDGTTTLLNSEYQDIKRTVFALGMSGDGTSLFVTEDQLPFNPVDDNTLPDLYAFDLTAFLGIEPVDSDGDGVDDNSDNCSAVSNANQRDADFDGVGNACDALVSVVALPDMNANGSPDLGVTMPGSTVVHVRDGANDTLINTIDFGTDAALQIVVVPDLDANGAPELAILNDQPSGQVRVQVRDSATGALTGNFFYGQPYAPVAMQVIDDYNTSGAPEIAVMGSDVTDAIRVQVKDADTGTTLDNVFLGNQGIGRDFVAVSPDQCLVWQGVPAVQANHDAGHQQQRFGRDRGSGCRSCDAEHPRTGARLGLDHHALQHLAG